MKLTLFTSQLNDKAAVKLKLMVSIKNLLIFWFTPEILTSLFTFYKLVCGIKKYVKFLLAIDKCERDTIVIFVKTSLLHGPS